MKRVHRRWHRRIGWVLVPVIALTLALADSMREVLPDNAALPPALTGAAAAGGSR